VNTNPNTGSYSALLGKASGTEPNGDSGIKQDASIPAGAHGTLSFWYWPASTDVLSNDWQFAQVKDTSFNVLATVFKINSNSQTWTQVTFDVSQWAGRTIRVVFGVHENGNGKLTSMYVDDVTVTTS
jgi:bacillopeptidase F (M6 metalloprotease family)